jgi:hypothetical protein
MVPKYYIKCMRKAKNTESPKPKDTRRLNKSAKSIKDPSPVSSETPIRHNQRSLCPVNSHYIGPIIS